MPSVITSSSTVGASVPVGCVLPFLKNLTGSPAMPIGWAECNGQVLSDAGSVYHGVTLPNLNGNNHFLRANATSGTTSGSATHSHKVRVRVDNSGAVIGTSGVSGSIGDAGAGYNSAGTAENFTTDGTQLQNDTGEYTNKINSEPPYYDIVMIMRIK